MQQSELDALDRQRQALELRKAGVPYSKIAEHLGYKHASGAHKAVASALKKTLQEPANDLRLLELERIDAMLFAIWPSVTKGQYKAVEVALKLMERRASLLGLDAPKKQAIDLTSKDEKLAFDYGRFINSAARPTGDSDASGENESDLHGAPVGKDANVRRTGS